MTFPQNNHSDATCGSSDPSARLSLDSLTVDVLTERGWRTVVDRVTLAVAPGETFGIVGESGSGKSMTALAIMGLLPRGQARITDGSVILDGNELVGLSRQRLDRIRGDRITMVFQEPMNGLNPAYTVGDQIAEILRRHRGSTRRAARAAAVRLLDTVGIPNSSRRVRAYPHEFSGGMRQRVMIAMALACEPTMLIADEPTTALDVTTQAQILELLRALTAENGISVIFITHDLGVVADICDRVAVMYAGQLVEQADVYDLFETPQHPYTSALMRAMPLASGPARGDLYSIDGQPPSPHDTFEGCRFAPRCDHAEDRCRSGPVGLELVAPGRHARCVLAHDEGSL